MKRKECLSIHMDKGGREVGYGCLWIHIEHYRCTRHTYNILCTTLYIHIEEHSPLLTVVHKCTLSNRALHLVSLGWSMPPAHPVLTCWLTREAGCGWPVADCEATTPHPVLFLPTHGALGIWGNWLAANIR